MRVSFFITQSSLHEQDDGYYLIIHRYLKIGTSIVTLRAVIARDEVECHYALSVTIRVPIFGQRCLILFIKHMSNNYSLDYLSILHRLPLWAYAAQLTYMLIV